MRGKRAGVSCRERSAVRVHYHRLRVVVGEGIMEPWLDRGFAGRVDSGMHTDSVLPQSAMAQNLFDHLALVDEGNNTHLAGALRAQERIGFPGLLDELTPLGRRDAAGFVFGI